MAVSVVKTTVTQATVGGVSVGHCSIAGMLGRRQPAARRLLAANIGRSHRPVCQSEQRPHTTLLSVTVNPYTSQRIDTRHATQRGLTAPAVVSGDDLGNVVRPPFVSLPLPPFTHASLSNYYHRSRLPSLAHSSTNSSFRKTFSRPSPHRADFTDSLTNYAFAAQMSARGIKQSDCSPASVRL